MSDWLARVFFISAVVVANANIGGCRSEYVYYRAREIPQTPQAAERTLRELAANPRPFERKILLIHGWNDTHERWVEMARWLDRTMTDAEVNVVVMAHSGGRSISELTRELFDRHGFQGEEVDVVGHSMGALIAREANRTGRIRIHTLYSMASPHDGAYLARYGVWARQLREMAPGSEFLTELNDDPASRDFETVTYWMEGDFLLRIESAESIGGTNVVLSESPKPFFRLTHNQLVMDPRTIYDVIRRLRGER